MAEGTKKKLYKLPLYIIGGITISLYLFFTTILLRGYFNFGEEGPASMGIGGIMVIVFAIMFPYFAFTELSIAGFIVSIILKKVKGISIWWVIGYIILTIVVIATFVILFKLYTTPV